MNVEQEPKLPLHKPRKYKIRAAISFVFCSLLILSTLITTTYTYINIHAVMDGTARDLINKTQNTIINETMAYLKPVMNLSRMGTSLFRSMTEEILDSPMLKEYMLAGLQVYPQSDMVYAADTQGNYISIGNLPEKRVFAYQPDKPLPYNALYFMEIVDRRHGGIKNFFRYLDAQGKVLAEEHNPGKPETIYDPRKREWFKRTLKLNAANWSEVYIGWNTTAFMTTASSPVFNADHQLIGVVAVDLPLERVDTLLSLQKASRSGVNFIIDEKGAVISFPEGGKNLRFINGMPTIKLLKEMNEPTLLKAYDYFKKSHKSQFEFTLDDIDYYAYFMEFPNEFASPWILSMVAPADDFVGPIKETNRDVILITLIILGLSTLFLVVFSHKISYPIETLADQMYRIKNLDLEGEELSGSSLQEISRMEEALTLMKDGIEAFSKFVPKELVRTLVSEGKSAGLGGERKELAILFSDIEGFTTISESMESDKLMVHLSDYLNRLSTIILKNKGTIDKYIGDAIMAFWGAPNEDGDKIYNACHAVLLCSRRLNKMNAEWQKKGRVPLPTRFGLHYGEAIVGNVGSADRLNYTIIGDSVNLASRLEGTNKAYGTHIIVSETIESAMRKKFLMRPLDIVAVKGKEKGIRIFELMAEYSDDPDLQPQDNQATTSTLTYEAFEYYLRRDWDSARELYQTILKLNPTDPVASLFVNRCAEFKAIPPAEIWDGVYHLKVK